ncbi:MAG: hypothetical protein PHQ40_03215 [Anaerolineaceae bacterium]|nr:hypothetical protein [Anaerolineaceae bacterium]
MSEPQKQVSFLPFNAINEFMRPDYRQAVVISVLQALPTLPDDHMATVNRLLKKFIQVPGFRNSLQAPVSIKLKPTLNAFEKNATLTGAILSAWSASKPELRQKVFEFLKGWGWEILPPEADRTKLPGFLTTWPSNADFQKLNDAFIQANPGFITTSDDVSLMAVWIGGRLPIDQEVASLNEKDEGS